MQIIDSYVISKVRLFTESSVTYLAFEGPGAVMDVPNQQIIK